MGEMILNNLNIINFSKTDYNNACKKITEDYNGAQCCGIANITIDNENVFDIYQYHFDTKSFNRVKISDSLVIDNDFEELKEKKYIKYLVLHNLSEDTYHVLYNTKIETLTHKIGKYDIVIPFDIMLRCEDLHQACAIIDSNAIENSINENMESILDESEYETEFNDREEIEFEEDGIEEGTTPYNACDEITEDWS